MFKTIYNKDIADKLILLSLIAKEIEETK
jgi:hypothetical protein